MVKNGREKPEAEATFNRNLVGNVNNLSRNVTAVGVENSIINRGRMILGISPNFYDAFETYIDKISTIRYFDVFFWKRAVSIKAWKRILSMGAAFDESVNFLKTVGLTVNFNREFHQYLFTTRKQMRDEEIPDRNKLLEVLNSWITRLSDFFSNSLLRELKTIGRKDENERFKIDDLVRKIVSIFKPFNADNKYYAEVFKFMILDTFTYEKAQTSDWDFPSKPIKDIMKEDFLVHCDKKIQIKILRHHYKKWQFDDISREQLIEDRWKNYVNEDGYLKFTPSEVELRFLARSLKIRILVYVSKWFHDSFSSVFTGRFSDMGYMTKMLDVGVDGNFVVGFLFSANNSCTVLNFQEIESRKSSTIFMSMGQFAEFEKQYDQQTKNKEPNAFDELYLRGTVHEPANELIYMAVGADPKLSTTELLKRPKNFFKKYCALMYHPDKFDTIEPVQFTMGKFGPKTRSDLMAIVKFFRVDDFIPQERLYSVVNVCYQIISDPVMRYV